MAKLIGLCFAHWRRTLDFGYKIEAIEERLDSDYKSVHSLGDFSLNRHCCPILCSSTPVPAGVSPACQWLPTLHLLRLRLGILRTPVLGGEVFRLNRLRQEP